MADYIHHVPGRLRINTRALKKNECRARQLKCHLEGMSGVLLAETSIVTGSVVIRYNTNLINATMILDSVRDLGYIQNTKVSNPAGAPAIQKLTDVLMTKLVETAVERSALALVSALL